MDNHINSLESSGEDKAKDKHFRDQFTMVYEGFFKEPQTMKQLSERINIDRANICWYCRDLRESNRIAPYKKGRCPITKHTATYWTTNPELFPQDPQLSLFNSDVA